MSTSFLELSLPRLHEVTGDNVHFIKAGLLPDRHTSGDGTGDTVYCTGNVGEVYGRLLMDQLCGFDENDNATFLKTRAPPVPFVCIPLPP